MSGFNFNIASVKPIVREAASMHNDGGGGNLGYMQQNRDDESQKKHKLDESIFGKKEEDIFIPAKDFKFTDNEGSFFYLVVKVIKKFFFNFL